MKRSFEIAEETRDLKTAEAFSDSWVNCFSDSPYTLAQVKDWLDPVALETLADKRVCEMGCGNGGLLQHVARYTSEPTTGVELGRCVDTARDNFKRMNLGHVDFVNEDILAFSAAHTEKFDFLYCIGVLHHMEDPQEGFRAVVRATKPGGSLHCWVYGYEGNFLIRTIVEPLRKIASRVPWRLNKYGIALPLAVPFFLASRCVKGWGRDALKNMPLYDYLNWIGDYSFAFHHHVAFDQLVSPRTAYIRKETIKEWLRQADLDNPYIIARNGNSWKFGGTKKP